mmetsp:Transcript_11342/g.33241  ORF Transcript_11342/g.33241 Transcript_11342/m.33241 type:complete len:208 (+) Transcript_11342:1758-2381(+)
MDVTEAGQKLLRPHQCISLGKAPARLGVGEAQEVAAAELQADVDIVVLLGSVPHPHDVTAPVVVCTSPHGLHLCIHLSLDAPHGKVGAVHDLHGVGPGAGPLHDAQDLREGPAAEERLLGVQVEGAGPHRRQGGLRVLLQGPPPLPPPPDVYVLPGQLLRLHGAIVLLLDQWLRTLDSLTGRTLGPQSCALDRGRPARDHSRARALP